MKSKYIKVLASFLFIISILIFLWNSLSIYIAGFIRECDRIKITDNNRYKIISLMEENINYYNYYKEIPDISGAKEIERYARFRNVEITVYYEDGTTYHFYIENTNNDPLSLHIRNEGYNVYFRSSEFIEDLIKTIIPLILVVFAVVLIRE